MVYKRLFGLLLITILSLNVKTFAAGERLELIEQAKAGDVEAQLSLADFYYDQGTVDSRKNAAKWYLKASKFGNPEAQTRLALMYERGEGFGKNFKKAVHLYHQAAKSGQQGFARFRLGLLYLNGHGVKKDEDTAYFWFDRGRESGHKQALEAYMALGGPKRSEMKYRAKSSFWDELFARAVAQALFVEPTKAFSETATTLAGKTKFLGFYLGDTASQVSTNNLNFFFTNGQCSLDKVIDRERSDNPALKAIPIGGCKNYEAYKVDNYVVVHNIFANTLIFDQNSRLQGVIASEKRPTWYFNQLNKGKVGGFFDGGHRIKDQAQHKGKRYWEIEKNGYHTKLFSSGQKSHTLRTTFTTTKKQYGLVIDKKESNTDVDYYQFFGCAYTPKLWEVFFKKLENQLPCTKPNIYIN